MKALKSLTRKSSHKEDRKNEVLIGLIDHYIKTGKAVGSDTLKNEKFFHLSSATLRNYFANLEIEGFLTQSHTSGGRIPTQQGMKFYAEKALSNLSYPTEIREEFKEIANQETKEIRAFLDHASNFLSHITNTAVFLSAPRFDQDFVTEIKLVPIDQYRTLSVVVTSFGVVQTEVLHTPKKLSSFAVKRIESYFDLRLKRGILPENLDKEEEALALKLYNELMVRYIVGYTNFSEKEIMRTGFSKLLTYSDFQDATLLANSLALFENTHSMRLILKECTKQNRLKYWIGDDLSPYTLKTPDCAVITAPYSINNQSVGAFGLLGPIRIPYTDLFNLLLDFTNAVSISLTRNIYKHKITFRQPDQGSIVNQKRDLLHDNLKNEETRIVAPSHFMLLEDKNKPFT